MHYPAVIYKDKNSSFGVVFPDLPGCYSAGDTINEAAENAAEALQFYIDDILEDGDNIPKPSTLDRAKEKGKENGKVEALILVYASIPAPPRRVNISIDSNLLDEIDREAKRRGKTRSAFLAEGAKALLG